VRRQLDKSADALGRGVVEEIGEIRIVLRSPREIVELALACETRPFAGRDLSGEDGANVAESGSDVWACIYCNFAGGVNSA
jgi:hypothetical protein